MLIIKRAAEEDAAEITQLAVTTFKDDNKLKPEGACMEGPPGHDSVESQRSWIKSCDYYKALLNDKIVGACLVWKKTEEEYVIDGVLIHPDFQNYGYGQQLINHAMKEHESAKKWTLSTPGFSKRNHHFYEKLGFVKVNEIENPEVGWSDYYYEKLVL